MRSPNAEQKPAIEHEGAVLLKAGAGSGKTFVLVEHIVERTRRWRSRWETERISEDFSQWIAEVYSGVVLMTFTKLAAGEIMVRLSERFEAQVKFAPAEEKSWWLEASSQLERMTVTTIDGFFYKLVKRGYFPNIPSDTEIILDESRRKQLFDLFDTWWEKNAQKFDPQIARDMALYRKGVVENLQRIFNDPALRQSWVDFKPQDSNPDKLQWLLDEVIELKGWNRFLALDVPEAPEKARANKNKWVALFDSISERQKPITTWEDVSSWESFIQSEIGQTRKSIKGYEDIAGPYFERWKMFRDSIEEWAQAMHEYRQNFEGRILPWIKALHALVVHTHESLVPALGMTYGDLEFFVLRGLRDRKVASRIISDFEYFVVDEFQDTSRVQFDIIRILTQNQSSKLFVVGDAKQAIYGFRGGELRVFQDLAESEGVQMLPLVSNYRSKLAVVDFNNKLFEYVFPLGLDWEGDDPHTVEMAAQVAAAQGDDVGQVRLIEVKLPPLETLDKKKWKSEDLNLIESRTIAETIEQKIKAHPPSGIAVLYRKLAPASYLMQELMQRNIGFTAQAKIPFSDDPISGMLLTLLEDYVTLKEGSWAQFMLTGYFTLLGFKKIEGLTNAIETFKRDLKIYGIVTAFDLFLSRMAVSNGLYASNYAELKRILVLCQGDVEKSILRLKEKSSDRWSADFKFGENSQQVIIQTSHASKGLEYDVVILGGLSASGRTRNQQTWMGSLPGSVQWVLDAQSRKRSATPQFLYEKELASQKEFAESKRLFYVACTRAKNELLMVLPQSSEYNHHKTSWARGLEKFLAVEALPTEVIELERVPDSFSDKPFFHMNPLNISQREAIGERPNFGVSSELSVTRLGNLLECPRQFYYRQILQLPEDWKEGHVVVDDPDAEIEEPRVISSSERGTKMHEALFKSLGQNFVPPLEWVNHPDSETLRWVLGEVGKFAGTDSKFEGEKTIKFPLFGFMLTGIPDLVIFGGPTQIWDYKTGARHNSSELKYWQQLFLYAWALWVNDQIPKTESVILKLCYMDEKNILTREVGFEEVKKSLFSMWEKLSDLSAVDLQKCPTCPYSGICPR